MHVTFIKIESNVLLLAYIENEVDMIVLPTLTESDLLTIGVVSFGARRKLSLLVKEIQTIKQPSPAVSAPEHTMGATLKRNKWPQKLKKK